MILFKKLITSLTLKRRVVNFDVMWENKDRKTQQNRGVQSKQEIKKLYCKHKLGHKLLQLTKPREFLAIKSE